MSTAVDRLTVEAGKYHGLVAGETLPRGEVIAQAKANGYDKREAQDMVSETTEIEIPRQANLFGDLWPDNQSNEPVGLPPRNSTLLESFDNWLNQKRQANAPYWPEHNYTHYKAQKNFAKAKDVARYYRNRYDTYTTVMITRNADASPHSLLEQTQSLNPAAYKQYRYRLLKRLSDDYAGVSVLAPKYDLPGGNSTDVLTHVHTMIWLPLHHSREAFVPLLDKHIGKVSGATQEQHPPDKAITVWHHERVRTPTGKRWICQPEGADTYRGVTQHGLDKVRGDTSPAPYELAENMPLMNVRVDALDLKDERCRKWLATLSAGTDDSQEPHETPGIHRWQPFGGFNEAEASVESGLRRQAERDYHRHKHWITPT